MAINPGSDLLTDALLAAEPQRAKAASERLAALAVNSGSEAPAFEEALAAESPAPVAVASKSPLTVSVGSQATFVAKPAHPYQQFEAVMLKSFFETMLPSKANSVFGSGLAGDVWKSMFAQSLATAVSETKGVGVARQLEARAQNNKSRS
jgi:hypothetical protein